MLRMAANIDQLDLAFEHVSKGDANNARFALMLVDNLVEITLHRLAQHKAAEHKARFRYRDKKEAPDPLLVEAEGRNFEPKVKYAKASVLLAEDTAASVVTLHTFRNQLYHVGLQHEPVLLALSSFYFGIACDLLSACTPTSWGYSPGMKLPERAAKYFGDDKHFMGGPEKYKKACTDLKTRAAELSPNLATSLAAHMSDVIDEDDRLIDFLATDGFEKTSRNEVIVASQAWPFAFTDEGKRFAQENGCPAKFVAEHVEWIAKNYTWKYGRDPVPKWRERSQRVAREKDPHKALSMYCAFMDQTEDIRGLIYNSASQLDAAIQEQIDRARGK